MKKSLAVILILLLLFPAILSAQVRFPELEELIDQVRIKKTIDGIDQKKYINVDGSPYLPEEFIKGEVKMETGETYTGELRYDIYADEVQFLVRDVVYIIAFPEDLAYVKLGETKLIFEDFTTESKQEQGYFEVLAEGECQLLAKKQLNLKDAVPAKPYVDAQPARFEARKDQFYLKNRGLPAVEVGKKSDLLAVLEDEKNDVSAFIRKEKISVNRKDDLIKLIDHYNNLIRIKSIIE